MTEVPAKVRLLAAATLALGLVEPLLFQWRNHPNQAVYFSAFAGGPRGAFGRYELDYWGNSLLQGVEWAARAARASGTRVVVSGRPHHITPLTVVVPGPRYAEVEGLLHLAPASSRPAR
jgi:hypothetical protein